MKATDVYTALAQDRSDAADHTRHVVIARYQHVAVRRCFEMETVDLGDATFAPVTAITEKRSRETLRRLSRADLGANGGRHVAGRANVSSSDFDAALVGD